MCRNEGHWVALTLASYPVQTSVYLLTAAVSLLSEPPDNVFVRIPDQMEEGVDYLLACDIISVAPVQNLKVKWYYGSEVAQIQTFNKTAAAPVNVSSTFNVTAKREHNGKRFRCEAELDLGLNGPQPLPRVAAEAPSPAVVQCEFFHLCFHGRISLRHPR